MKLIVGLGNPGPEYRDTRHNVGFKVVDELARRHGVSSWNEKFGGLEARIRIADVPAILSKPLSFMNLSGSAVQQFSAFYKVESPEILVIVDDVELPLGRLRARGEGGAGGHNGLKSVISSLGTEKFARLRVGVGRGNAGSNLSNFVLGRFTADEQEIITAAVLRAADATEVFIERGIGPAMNMFNAAPKQDSAE
ncbi:MAG TPA: aminoacyl-tRNA hydrolase [Vicinamibacterales bacterium]|nr:aminoacyl-tRNA hydrolase [Vicinamibacterales bacterium]